MGREIKLDGGEISLLKKIGLSGTPVLGKLLVERIEEMETGEFIDTLCGLIDQGYELAPASAEEFAQFQREDIARSMKIVLDADIRAE